MIPAAKRHELAAEQAEQRQERALRRAGEIGGERAHEPILQILPGQQQNPSMGDLHEAETMRHQTEQRGHLIAENLARTHELGGQTVDVQTIHQGMRETLTRRNNRGDALGIAGPGMPDVYDARSGRTYQNGPSAVSSNHGFLSNQREHSHGIYNTLEAQDPMLGIGGLRFIRGSLISWDSFYDPMRPNLPYQAHIPFIQDSGPDFAQFSTTPRKVGLQMPGETPITHRPERKFWPLSDEREALGRGKLRVLPHFCFSKVNSPHQTLLNPHLKFRQPKSNPLSSLKNLLERKDIIIVDQNIATKTILMIDMSVSMLGLEVA